MFLFWTAVLVAADQLTKVWAQGRFTQGGPELDLALGFSFTYVRNDGAAFGLFRSLAVPIGPVTLDGTLLLGLVSAAVSVTLIVFLWRRGRDLAPVSSVALTFVLAGAIGNMIDRFARGFVVDFVHFQQGAFDFAVFNLADSLVVVGAGLLILSAFRPHPSDASGAEAMRPSASASAQPSTDDPTSPRGASSELAPTAEREAVRTPSRFERAPVHERELVDPDVEAQEMRPEL